MAYGKIKADSIIYDSSGSDVEATIASLATPTPEGTVVKSTGEAVTTKFLRTDGDGSCSWQLTPVPGTITVGDESSDTTCNVLFTTAATGDLPPKTGTNLTFNSSSGLLTATSFNGSLTGDVTGDVTGTATVATNVTVVDESSDTTCFVLFADGATGNLSVKSGTNLAFNSSTGLLSPSAVTTTGNVTVGGDLVVNGSTTTVNTATLEVEDKNIEIGKVSTPSDTTADGGGITLKGATDKTINWINSTDNWTFNQNIEVTGTASAITITAGEGNNSSLYLISDDGDDNGDYWCIFNQASDNDLYFKNKTSGSYATKAIITEEGEVHDSLTHIRAIPANATTSAYTLVASDRGKTVTNTSGGVTIPYNVFAAGDAVTIVNHSGSAITLTQGSNMTLYNCQGGTTGNRTLAARGMATVWYQAQNLGYIGGSGLS